MLQNKFKIDSDNTIIGDGISLLLDTGEYYSLSIEESNYLFVVNNKISKDKIEVSWYTSTMFTEELVGVTEGNPIVGSEFTSLFRGFSVNTNSLYKTNFLRRGYFDIDNIIFDIFYKSINKWNWSSSSHDSQWETKDSKYVDFFFFNKRPITRQPYAERTLGAKDNVDQQYQNSKHKSNNEITTHPYMVFQPIHQQLMDDVMFRVEEFYEVLENVPEELLDNEYKDVNIYQPPQLYEFSYQINSVTDSWKDCRVLQAHLLNSVFPRTFGERFVRFPSGITHSVRIEQTEVVPDEDKGLFEFVTTYYFTIPLVEEYPELTWGWITGHLNFEGDPIEEVIININD